jgi:cytochrome c oxidase subunit 2
MHSPKHSPGWWLSRLVIGAIAIAILVGCGGVDYPQTTLFPRSDNNQVINDLYAPLTWLAIVIFVIVQGLLLYSIFRFRVRSGDNSIPPQIHGNTRLEIAWTLAPSIVVILMLILTYQAMAQIEADPPADALRVRVIGHQWWWEIHYLDHDVVTANEIHIPIDRAVYFELQSDDVIHSFWVPRLMGKRDLMPGSTNTIWFTPQEEGLFLGQCAEYCGTAHAQMRYHVVVESEMAFNDWLERQGRPAVEVTGDAAAGAELFVSRACVTCHTIRGTDAIGTIGPDLTHVGSRAHIAGGILENTPADVTLWLSDPQGVKPGNEMILPLALSQEDIRLLTAYITALR